MVNNQFAADMKRLALELESNENALNEAVEQNNNPELKEIPKQNTKLNASTTILDTIINQGGPSKQQIDEWKMMFGEKVFAVYFDENDFYIYRPLMRPEWKDIIRQWSKSPNPQDDILDELIVMRALLFPMYTTDLVATINAGTIETLSKQIRVSSNFVPDQVAMQMIQKL